MKEIKLSNSDFTALVDDEDFERVNQYKWLLHKSNKSKVLYVYSTKNNNKTALKLHRFIMNITSPKIHIDHINDNGLNNQKSNLRICTNQQNTSNKRKIEGFTSKYKGVSWSKRLNKWRATIFYFYKQTHLGDFNSEEEAARAYNVKAKELFKEFARLNDVPDGPIKRPKSKIKSSKYFGIHLNNNKRWIVTVKGKYYGSFFNEEEAATVVDFILINRYQLSPRNNIKYPLDLSKIKIFK